MIDKEIKARYSCRRKRDLVTGLVIFLFLMIICLEFYLVVILPIQLRREDTLSKHIAKERLARQTDQLRWSVLHVQAIGGLQKGEVALAKGALDIYAAYIRTYRDQMSFPEIVETQNALSEYAYLLPLWAKGSFAFSEEKLNLDAGMKALEKKLH